MATKELSERATVTDENEEGIAIIVDGVVIRLTPDEALKLRDFLT